MSNTFDTSTIPGGGNPGGSQQAQSSTSQNLLNTQNATGVVNNGNFSFLYDKNITEVIKDIKDGDLLVTRLSNLNNFYYRVGYNYNSKANMPSGISTAVNCKDSNKNMAARLSSSQRAAYGNAQYDYTKMNNGTVLANCVGWANGRLLEIWHRAVQIGYIKKLSSGNYAFASNNKEIVGKFDKSAGYWPLPWSAYQWWDYWPGGTAETGWYKSQIPQVGAVVCWGNGRNGDQSPGHVAIVEEIHNPGEPNEELVISHSAYTPNGVMWLVKLSTIKKSTNYTWYTECTLRGFLISPVCQLASTNASGMIKVTTNGDRPVSEGDKDMYKILNEQIQGKHIEKDLPIGANVRIVDFGYKSPDGGTIIFDRVNNMGVNGVIKTKDSSKNFPYGVWINQNDTDSFRGYYRWDGIEIISDGTLTEQTLKIWWDDESNSSLRPTSLTVKLKINTLSANGKKNSSTREITISESTSWTALAVGLPKYTDAKTLTEFEWELPSLPKGYEKIRTTKINSTTAITISNQEATSSVLK